MSPDRRATGSSLSNRVAARDVLDQFGDGPDIQPGGWLLQPAAFLKRAQDLHGKERVALGFRMQPTGQGRVLAAGDGGDQCLNGHG